MDGHKAFNEASDGGGHISGVLDPGALQHKLGSSNDVRVMNSNCSYSYESTMLNTRTGAQFLTMIWTSDTPLNLPCRQGGVPAVLADWALSTYNSTPDSMSTQSFTIGAEALHDTPQVMAMDWV